jgi:hypothetical protein
MLQRTPRQEAKRRRQARWRERERRGVMVVMGEVPRDLVETLIDYDWLDENASPGAIVPAMVAALRTLPRRINK